MGQQKKDITLAAVEGRHLKDEADSMLWSRTLEKIKIKVQVTEWLRYC